MARTVDTEAQEKKIHDTVQYVHDKAYFLFISSPLTLYALNKEVNFVSQSYYLLRLKEASVPDKHWSITEENQQSVAD